MKIDFVKMHGAGNDYIFVDCFEQKIEDPESFAKRHSSRHFGIGSDGLVLILQSEKADCLMRIFNADGSEAKMCGNAIRCVGKYYFENISKKSKIIDVETLSGIKKLNLEVEKDLVNFVSVDMGKANFVAKNVPFVCNSSTFVNQPFELDNQIFDITVLSVGNPHCVIEVDDVDSFDIEKYGTMLDQNPAFEQGVNAEFIQILNSQTIKMRVLEHGSGETLACGTGACAAVAACVKNGKLKADTDICVEMQGGNLFITCKDDYTLTKRGDAVEVFRGMVEE